MGKLIPLKKRKEPIIPTMDISIIVNKLELILAKIEIRKLKEAERLRNNETDID